MRYYGRRGLLSKAKSCRINISNNESIVASPINKTVWAVSIFILVAVFVLGPIIGTAIANSNVKKHECQFSQYGTSSTTCTMLGETTYWCIYHYSETHQCTNKKVVKDTEYAPHSFQVIDTLSDKIDQSIYLSKCKWCQTEKTETVTHSITQYKDKIGNYGVIGVEKEDVEKSSGVLSFECLFYSSVNESSNKDTDYYIVLKLYDKNFNRYATYYMRAHILVTKRCSHFLKVTNSTHISKYYDHRWELAVYAPKDGIELKQ